MKNNVLMSIKPEFAKKIFTGEKKIEIRKVIFTNRNVDRIYVYSSSPVKKVVGYFTILEILEDTPHSLWGKIKDGACLSKERYDSYFKGYLWGYAIKIKYVKALEEAKSLEDFFCGRHNRPPQNFMYMKK